MTKEESGQLEQKRIDYNKPCLFIGWTDAIVII